MSRHYRDMGFSVAQIARRCLAAERAGRESLRVRLADEERANGVGVGILCGLAFPGDES